MRSLVIAVVLAWFAAADANTWADEQEAPEIRLAVVKVTTTARGPDLIRPWIKKAPEAISGTGVVIPGKRILTNAHVVMNASQVSVQPDKSGDEFSATVEAIGPGIDLAVLKLDDESFFDQHPALELRSAVPTTQQTVYAYGYPEGGNDLSITKGIVSRVEYADYRYGTSGLRIQVDAAINPGNSGGPALIDGGRIGIIFSRLQGSDNIGYIIPVEEIALFLKDVADGHYDGKPVFLDDVQNLQAEALRARLGLAQRVTGVVVRKPFETGESYPLKPRDILTHVGSYKLDNLGMVRVEGDRRLPFRYLVQRLARDDLLTVTLLRDGKETTVDVPVAPGRDVWLLPYLKGGYPSYVIYGPLAFSEATDDFVRLFPEEGHLDWASEGNPIFTRFGDRPSFPGERVVVVPHPMFIHKISKGYQDPYVLAVNEVNGVRIRNLPHLIETLRDATGEFVEISFSGHPTETIVFRRAEALAATEDVLLDNGIRMQCSPDMAKYWKKVP